MLDRAEPKLLFQVLNIFLEGLVNRILTQTFKLGWSNTAYSLLLFFLGHTQVMKFLPGTF